MSSHFSYEPTGVSECLRGFRQRLLPMISVIGNSRTSESMRESVLRCPSCHAPLRLGAAGGYVRGKRDDVVLREVGDDAFHQFIQGAIAGADLKTGKLPNDVGR